MFTKGQSGNPGGRPKGIAEVRELAQQYAPEAIERLAKIMRDGEDRAAIAAAGILLDRGFGKATQPLSADGETGGITVILRRFHCEDHETPALEDEGT